MTRTNKIWLLSLLCLAVSPTWAQSKFLSKLPWNGDWMSQAKDQMVHGEDYRGYPGPLVKMFYSFGMGDHNPAVDFELLTLVQREAPRWFGNCNGWSSAAILFDEPNEMVVNGVKLFSGEVKALLSGVWKNHVLIRVDDGNGIGMSAASFDQILDDYIASDEPIIFDVTIGAESWNYPVAGFERTGFEEGDWFVFQTTVSYTTTFTLAQSDIDRDRTLLWNNTYTYRQSKITGEYEWTGNSVNDRPHRAWFPTQPWSSGRWHNLANRTFNMDFLARLQELATREDAARDLYEPNNERSAAAGIPGNLLLGSLDGADEDWFDVAVAAGESVSLNFAVYDGPVVDVRVVSSNGALISEEIGVAEALINLPSGSSANYAIHVKRTAPAEGTTADNSDVFYKLTRDEHRSWYQAPALDGVSENTKLTLINPNEESNDLAWDTVYPVNALGSHTVDNLEPGRLYRAPKRGIWSLEGSSERTNWKKYYRTHPQQLPYRVPHLTFRNGWETSMEVVATTDDEVWLEVCTGSGEQIQRTLLDRDMLRGATPLSEILTPASRDNGAWFALVTSPGNLLSGSVFYQHASGIYAPYDIEGSPRHGEMSVPGLLEAEDGWIGLSLLNVSGVYNEVMYRLVDGSGNIVSEGLLPLEPGQRFLGTPQSLTGMTSFGDDAVLMFSSQYELETLALRREYATDRTYAYHLPGSILDVQQYAWISVSEKPANQILIFDNRLNTQSNWVWLQAYAEDGSWQGELRVTGRAVRGGKSVTVTMAELLENDGVRDAEKPITYFSVTGQIPLLVSELITREGSSAATFVRPVRVYDDP